MMEKKLLWAGLVLLIGLLVITSALSVRNVNSFKGVEYSPAPSAPEFYSLVDQSGRPVTLESLKGKVKLVFFGYTNCPDVCPTTMAKMKQVYSELGDSSSDVVVVMVTTDPARDMQERMKNYVANFNPAFLGVTGAPSDLEKVWKDYGVSVLDNGTTHSTRVYVIDRSGNMRLTFPYEMTVADILSDLQILLRE